jgi:hypothetical protein
VSTQPSQQPQSAATAPGFEFLSLTELKAINDALLDGLASVCEIERLQSAIDPFVELETDMVRRGLYPTHPTGEVGGQRFHEAFSYLSRVVFARANHLEDLLSQQGGAAR